MKALLIGIALLSSSAFSSEILLEEVNSSRRYAELIKHFNVDVSGNVTLGVKAVDYRWECWPRGVDAEERCSYNQKVIWRNSYQLEGLKLIDQQIIYETENGTQVVCAEYRRGRAFRSRLVLQHTKNCEIIAKSGADGRKEIFLKIIEE